MGRVEGKVAIITGAASGLGEADARLLRKEGASVIMTDINRASGEAIAEEIGAEFVHQDVSEEETWPVLVDGVMERHGRLDVLVNNAGIAVIANVARTTTEIWRRTLAVHLDATFFGCHYALPAMKKSGGGSIINMSSTAALVGLSPYFAYSAAKGEFGRSPNQWRTTAVSVRTEFGAIPSTQEVSTPRWCKRHFKVSRTGWAKMPASRKSIELPRVSESPTILPTWFSTSPRTNRNTSRGLRWLWTTATPFFKRLVSGAGQGGRMNIQGLVHVNINCSNFERSRAFYEKLGFELFLEVPESNTPEVAAAVGFEEYRLEGGLMRLQGARYPLVIDLLEWRTPSDSEPPYAALNHLGIARIALYSSDLDADVAELRAQGVEIVGEPATVVWGGRPSSRFVCFKDPDGTVLELVQDLKPQ